MNSMKELRKLKKHASRRTVEAFGCIACYGTPQGCIDECGADFNAFEKGIQNQLNIQYLTIYD